MIAVDDGSKDDTWDHLCALAQQFPGRMLALRHPKNAGKRAALVTAILRADSEVVITVDSDSILDRNAIRHLVAPIQKDPRVASVSGQVFVLNEEANILTRMQAANFAMAYAYQRAAQSCFGSVLCCPGVLTGYRRSALLGVLTGWSEQTFLGAPCMIGEDRALTTWLLAADWRSVYQSTAVAYTMMPTSFKGTCRMLIRWERGNIREALRLIGLMSGRWNIAERWWACIEVILDLAYWPAAFTALASLARLENIPGLFATTGLVTLLLSLNCLRTKKSLDLLYYVAYSFFNMFALGWLFPFSLLTVRDGRWLTR